MKIIFYARRKSGSHGFLKFSDESNSGDGEEIHFRTTKTLTEIAERAFGVRRDQQGKPLKLIIKNKKRLEGLLELIEIARGEDRDMTKLWEILKVEAKNIDSRENLMDGYERNCHILTFEVLERAGLKAPREEYAEQVRLKTEAPLSNSSKKNADLAGPRGFDQDAPETMSVNP